MDLQTFITNRLPDNLTQEAENRINDVMTRLLERFTNDLKDYDWEEKISRKTIREEFRSLLTVGIFKEQDSKNFDYLIMDATVDELLHDIDYGYWEIERWTRNARKYFVNAIKLIVNSIVEFGKNQWEINVNNDREPDISSDDINPFLHPLEDLLERG